MLASATLSEINSLDPAQDPQRIVFLTTRVEFPFDSVRALEFALFRTYCVPSISSLLDRTQEFGQRSQKRYDDTDLIISEIMDWGYDSDRGRRAIRRMNQIHGRFQISNDDFLYVLSTFVYVPIRWIDRFGWRPLVERERQAMFYFWREVGRRMNIKNLPDGYAGFEQFNLDYERRNFRFSETNQRVGVATRNLFASWFPAPLRPLVRKGIDAMMDDPLLEAFGFPKPSPALRRLMEISLRARGRAARLFFRRPQPCLRTELPHPSYPEGHVIESVGPPPAAPPPARGAGAE